MRAPRLVLGLACVCALACAPRAVAGQLADVKSTELPPVLDREREIALARSAAPPEISREATVLALVRGQGYEVAAEGTNGVTCLVSRTWPQSIEPHCFDREGSRTILPMQLRQAELRELGWTKEEIERDVADGFRTGRLSAPRRPAMSWMMSGAQVLVNDAGQVVGAWKPHLMIYHPYLTEADLGITGAAPADGPMIDDPGRPTANIIVVVPAFVQPDLGGAG